MQPELTTKKALIPAIVLAVLVFTAMILISYRQTQYANSTAALVAHTEEELFFSTKVLSTVKDNETGSRGFIITGQQEFLEPLAESKINIHREIEALKKLTADHPTLQKSVDSLLFYADKRIIFSDSTITLRKEKGLTAAIQLVSTGKGKLYMDNIRRIVSGMQQEVIIMQEESKAENKRAITVEKILLLAATFVILTLMIIVFWKEKQSLQQKLQKNTREQLALLSLQINQSNDAIYTLDANQKIKSWNRGAENLYGFTKEEALDKDPAELLQTDSTSAEIKIALKEITHHKYRAVELKRKTKAGAVIYVHSSTTDIRNDIGIVTGYVAVSFDITGQKKLREQVRHLANMVEQSSEAIISIGLDERIMSWNNGAVKLHGYSKEEAIGRTAPGLRLIGLNQTEVAADLQELSEKGTWKKEMICYHKDGSSFFGLVTANQIKDDHGEINSLFFLVKDISDRKHLEEQLKKYNEELEEKVKERTEDVNRSEKRYRYLFENNPLPMWVIDLNTFKFLDVNKMAVYRYGYSREEFLSMTAVDIRPDEEKQLFIQTDHSFRQEAANYNRGIWRHRKKDGTVIQVEIIAHEINFEGVPARLILSNDITEKMKAEEKLIKSEKIYKTIASSIPGSIICLLDTDYRYLLIEGDIAEKMGYSKEQMLGNKAGDVLPPEIFALVKDEFDRTFKGEVITRENSRIGYDTLSRFIPLKDENDLVYAVMTVTLDVTPLKNAQRSIEELNHSLEEKIKLRTEQLRKSNEELESFSYSVSHDLRAPLRAIIGYAAILEEDYGNKLDDEAKRITGVIKTNTAKMGSLIDDLLTFSRMGRHEIVKTTIDNNEMLNEIIVGLNSNGNIEWVVHSLPDAKGDRSMIRQVWINLILNAVKYSGNNAAQKIEIGSFKQGGQLVFFVKDNGVGFDEKYKAKLFKVFQRLHSAEQFEGTGIGLAIVEKIVAKHGGEVWAEAEVGKGATFYFSLPESLLQN